jgi:hypothetical protein
MTCADEDVYDGRSSLSPICIQGQTKLPLAGKLRPPSTTWEAITQCEGTSRACEIIMPDICLYVLEDRNETAPMVTPVCCANMIYVFLTQAKYISVCQSEHVQGNGEDYITRSFMVCTPHQILFNWTHQEKWGHVASMGDMKSAYRVLVQRPDGNRSLGRPRQRWKDNIITGLQVGWGCMDWTGLAQDSDRR